MEIETNNFDVYLLMYKKEEYYSPTTAPLSKSSEVVNEPLLHNKNVVVMHIQQAEHTSYGFLLLSFPQ